MKDLQKLMGPEGNVGAIKLIGGQEAPVPEASPRTAAAPPRSGHLSGRRHLARSSVPSPGDPPVILHTFASEMCRSRWEERRRALCRDDHGIRLRSSHVLSRPPPAAPPPPPRLRGQRPAAVGASRRSSITDESLPQTGTHMWLCCILQRTRLHPGPGRRHVFRTHCSVESNSDPAACRAVCSDFSGLPFCKLFFFSFSDNKKLQIIRTKMFKAK